MAALTCLVLLGMLLVCALMPPQMWRELMAKQALRVRGVSLGQLVLLPIKWWQLLLRQGARRELRRQKR